eukprot:72875_1
MTLPTLEGRCGLPYFAEIEGRFFILGVHAVSRPGFKKIGSVIYSNELWRQLCGHIQKNPVTEKWSTTILPEDKADAKTTDYVRASFLDKTAGDDHEVYPTYVPKQVMEKKKEITPDLLHPEGEGIVLLAGWDNKLPADTKSAKVPLGIEGMEKVFPTTKVPTLTAEEIIKTMPEKVTSDANGNKHVGYTRIAAGKNNTGKPGIGQSVEAMGVKLADLLIAEMGLETEVLVPLSIQEAISGTSTIPTFKRDSAVGGMLASIFPGCSKKVDYVDYDEKTRDVQFKGIHGKLVEKWTKDQMDLAKKGQRLHFPCTSGYKTETLPPEKLYKKRVFQITSFPTWINQKRIATPVQNILVKYKNCDFTRVPLVFDPITQAHELVQWLYEGNAVAVAFDWASFDWTVDINVLHGVGAFIARFYERLGPEGNKLGQAAMTFMQDMGAGSFLLEKAWLHTKGGVESGSGCTSLIDSIAVMIVMFYSMEKLLESEGHAMPLQSIFKTVKTVHGGDDIEMATTKAMARLIDLEKLFKVVHDTFGMTLTLDTKTEGKVEWKSFDECSFLSRHFVPHPDFPVWLSKLKEESIGSMLNWSSTSDPIQQARQVEASAMEVFPYGRKKYDQYRTFSMRHFKNLNIPIEIPPYDQTSEWLGTAIMCKEHPAELEERFLLESSSLSSSQKTLRSPDLSLVIPTDPNKSTKMPFHAARSAFVQKIKTAKNLNELTTSSQFVEMAMVGTAYDVVPAEVKLKDKTKKPSVPRNTPTFWTYLAFRINKNDIAPAIVAHYEHFIKEWETVDPGNCHTPALKQLKNLQYLLSMDITSFKFDLLREWTVDVAVRRRSPRRPDYPNGLSVKETEKVETGYHRHICIQCGCYYYHVHRMNTIHHRQHADQCPNTECTWYQGEDVTPLKVVSYPVKVTQKNRDRAVDRTMIMDIMDVKFAKIAIMAGKLTESAQILCEAGLSEPLYMWHGERVHISAAQEIETLDWKYEGNTRLEILFPNFSRSGPHWNCERDVPNSAPVGELLPMSAPNKGGESASSGRASSAAPSGGGSTLNPTVDVQAPVGAETVQPAAVTSGAAASDTVLTPFGGMIPDTLALGGFANSILAYVYEDIPQATIPVSAATVEYAKLYSWQLNPWDAAAVGPYISAWANMHDRFVGGFRINLQVASAAVILGKIGIYYLPAGTKEPVPRTRTTMAIFPHTVIDLYSPSSNGIEVRPTTADQFYISKATATRDWGQIIIMAYTAISNVMSAETAATAPPIYPTIALTPDSIYAFPLLEAPTPPPVTVPPIPPMGTLPVTEGHNVAPRYFSNGYKPTITKEESLMPEWMATSGRMTTTPTVAERGDNQVSFYWGQRFPENVPAYPGFMTSQLVIASKNLNKYRYYLDYDENKKFIGLRSVVPQATIGRSYNVSNDEKLAGTDQTAQKFFRETKIETINYIVTGVRVWNDPDAAPWWGCFTQADNTETPWPVRLEQFGESPAALKVRMLTLDDKSQHRFYELQAANIGVKSGSNTPTPKTEGLENPALFRQGPEVPFPGVPDKVPKRFPTEVSVTKSLVCDQTLPTTGGIVPSGFKLITWWDPKDKDNWLGLPAVLRGVRGVTTPMTEEGFGFLAKSQAFLMKTRTQSYVLQMVSYDSSAVADILINKHGSFIYTPDFDYGVVPTFVDEFFFRLLSTDRHQEWSPINSPTPGLFQSRLTLSRAHSGFVLPGTNEPSQVASMRDTLNSATAGAAVFGGMFSGLGQGLSSVADMRFKKEMQRNEFGQETAMQNRFLSTQTKMNERTNEAREYAASRSGRAQEYSATQNASAIVNSARTRVVAGNTVSTII